MIEGTLKEACDKLRKEIGATASDVKSLMGHYHFLAESAKEEDRGEMKANIMLTYRHLEDARMRIGKVLQAMDGGKSVYDK